MSVKSIVDAIESVLPARRPIEHHEPHFTTSEQWYLSAGMQDKTGFYTDILAKKLQDTCNVNYAIPVSSGTAALHLILLALGIKAGEEVLVPSLTFVATANAVRYVGAIPHFYGHNPDLWKYLDENTLPNERGRLNPKTNRVISAVIAVDLLGFPADLGHFERTCSKFGLYLIEDACQAFGSNYENRPCGSFGDAAALSFNCNKTVTGLGGGAVLTKLPVIANEVKSLATTARAEHPWFIEHYRHAFNYRISSITAALICSQLERLSSILEEKLELHNRYKKVLDLLEDEINLNHTIHNRSNYWLNTFIIHWGSKTKPEEILCEMHRRGLKGRALFTPLHTLSMFEGCPAEEDMFQTMEYFTRAVCLPSGLGLLK